MANTKNQLLRHTLATIAYRFSKSVRSHQNSYADFQAGNDVRTPHEIVTHILQLLLWSGAALRGVERGPKPPAQNFEAEILAVQEQIRLVDSLLEPEEIQISSANKLIQGPFSDILTHVGQLSMLRRLNKEILPSENFSIANIKAGHFE